MAVIVGGGSSISSTLLADGTGVVSINFDLQANIERLWQLGSFSPYDTTATLQRTVNLVVYGTKPTGGGGTNSTVLTPSTTCEDTTTIPIEFSAPVCTGGAASFSDSFFATSYSYSKDVQGFGRETWAFTTKPIIDTYTGTIYMLGGLATGQITTGSDYLSSTSQGFVIDEAASVDSLGNNIESMSGSVSSGFPGLGEYETKREVVVSEVGGSVGKSDGYKGQCSCSIPVQPIFL